MIDPLVAMMVWPQSTDTGDEADWEAFRAEVNSDREKVWFWQATEEDWKEFWKDVSRGE